MFNGSIVALITPFRNGVFDDAAYRDLIAWHLESGTNGIVPCGTTGEASTLSLKEHKRVVEVCVETVGGQIPVIAGTGSNSTQDAIALTRHAKECGATAALVVTPYYNKPNQEGLFQHFKAIHDTVELPIVIYNIPARCVIDMSVETMARLAALPNIVGVKDATQDLARPIRTRLAIDASFCQLSGEDGTALPFLAAGGHGCISVTANVAPELCARMHAAWAIGDIETAAAINDRLMPMHGALFCETNPAPAKYALSIMEKCGPEVRLPLVTLAKSSQAIVQSALDGLTTSA